ncbi:MAG: Mur ligase family protein [Actinomycetota bacterium]
MSFSDPFPGYSIMLRVLIYGVVPLFGLVQFIRLRRALHVFQLEGYKPERFLDWCRSNRSRALFLSRPTTKKPLAMTSRAWRILIVAVTLSVLLVLLASGAAHLGGGWPFDVATFAVAVAVAFLGAPRTIVVADRLLAPVQSAINDHYSRAARRKLDEIAPRVVAITGSFGKTSTKFAIAGLVGGSPEVLATPASFNTPMGICRTINEHLQGAHRFFVVEMGAYGEGEIAQLCELVRPSIGVLTAIGPAHLERFGSMDAIRRTKYEVVTCLPDDGVAVMNVDDPEVRRLADETSRVRVIRYGLDAGGRPDVTASAVEAGPEGTSLVVELPGSAEELAVRTRLLGRHSIGHVLAAVAVALAAGRALGELGEAIARLRPVEHRLQLLEGTGGVTVIDDAFNSNPEGADAALDVLAAMPHARKVVVTPGIVELGEMQAEANQAFGARAARVADALVVVARVNRDAIVAGATSANGNAEVVAVDSLAQAQERLETLLGPGSVVLFENDLPDQYEG